MSTYNDIFQVVAKGNCPAGEVVSVFHYVPDSTPLNKNDAANALAHEFSSAAFLATWVSKLSNSLTFSDVRVTDLADLDVLYDLSVSIPGGDTAGVASFQDTITFQSAQPAVGVHRASKHYGPISNAALANGYISGSLSSVLTSLAALLDTPLTTTTEQGFSGVWTLVVVKRIRTGTPGNYRYTLPGPSNFPAVAYPATGWYWNAHPGSQNSRKWGVGA